MFVLLCSFISFSVRTNSEFINTFSSMCVHASHWDFGPQTMHLLTSVLVIPNTQASLELISPNHLIFALVLSAHVVFVTSKNMIHDA